MSKNQVQEEFRSDDGYSTVPSPVTTGSAKLPNSNHDSSEPMPTITKSGMIGAIVSAAHRMDKDTLSKVYKSTLEHAGGPCKKDAGEPMPTLAKITPGQIVKEDLDELLGTQEDLSEDFRSKAAILFEAALTAATTQMAAQLEEEAADALAAAITTIEEETESNVNDYLELVITEWMEANRVGVRSALREQLNTSFMTGLKNLFAEHYVDLPEESVNVVESLADELDSLRTELNERSNAFIELREEVKRLHKERMIAESSQGLTAAQADRFAALANAVEFVGDSFADSMAVIKESVIGVSTTKPNAAQMLSEEVEEPKKTAPSSTTIHPDVAAVLNVAKRTMRQ
ncbi:MAG: hypothetical protein DDT26_00322 [Dehalococcoidia bacterium]|nr:hypothetical protein [Chloroflexota bacterium]